MRLLYALKGEICKGLRVKRKIRQTAPDKAHTRVSEARENGLMVAGIRTLQHGVERSLYPLAFTITADNCGPPKKVKGISPYCGNNQLSCVMRLVT